MYVLTSDYLISSIFCLILIVIVGVKTIQRLKKNNWFHLPSGDSSLHFFFMNEKLRIKNNKNPLLLIKNASTPNVPNLSYFFANLFNQNFLYRNSWIIYLTYLIIGSSFILLLPYFYFIISDEYIFVSSYTPFILTGYILLFPDNFICDKKRIQHKLMSQRYQNNIFGSLCLILDIYHKMNYSIYSLIVLSICIAFCLRSSKFMMQSLLLYFIFGVFIFGITHLASLVLSILILYILFRSVWHEELSDLFRLLHFNFQRLSSFNTFFSFSNRMLKINNITIARLLYPFWLLLPNNSELKNFYFLDYSLIFIINIVFRNSLKLSSFDHVLLDSVLVVVIVSFLFSLNLFSFAGEGFRYFGSLCYIAGALQFLLFVNKISFSSLIIIDILLLLLLCFISLYIIYRIIKNTVLLNRDHEIGLLPKDITRSFENKTFIGYPMTSPFTLLNSLTLFKGVVFPMTLSKCFISKFTCGYPLWSLSDKLLISFNVNFLVLEKSYIDESFTFFLKNTQLVFEEFYDTYSYKIYKIKTIS